MPEAMDASCEIRRLVPADVALLRVLNTLFGRAFGDAESYQAAPPADTYLSGLLAKDHVIALVATVADEVAGGLVAYELDKFERERREIYIYDLAVADEHRPEGVATALIERLRETAAERGARALDAQDRSEVRRIRGPFLGHASPLVWFGSWAAVHQAHVLTGVDL